MNRSTLTSYQKEMPFGISSRACSTQMHGQMFFSSIGPANMDQHPTISVSCLLNTMLVAAFFAEAILAKSRFDAITGGWFGHMVLTIVFILILIIRYAITRIIGLPVYSPPRLVSWTLCISFIWACICCIIQPNAYANLIYLLVFAANVFVCFYVVPSFLLPNFGMRAVLFFAVPICLTNLANLACGVLGVPGSYFMGRLRGFSINTLEASVLGWVGIVLALWIIINSHLKSRCAWLFSVSSLGVVLLSRTRSYILAALIGSSVILASFLRADKTYSRQIRVLLIIAIVFPFLMLLITAVGSIDQSLESACEYLRVSGSMDEILSARMVHWQAGLQHAQQYPVFGRGPMAKFGDTTDPTVNTYQMESCYCNTWLTMAQSYGIPGMVLFILFVLTMFLSSVNGLGMMPLLSRSLLVAGLSSSFSATWLVSFGDVGDRAIWLMMGLALAVQKSKTRCTRGGDETTCQYQALFRL